MAEGIFCDMVASAKVILPYVKPDAEAETRLDAPRRPHGAPRR